jgi:hypothetical protein
MTASCGQLPRMASLLMTDQAMHLMLVSLRQSEDEALYLFVLA